MSTMRCRAARYISGGCCRITTHVRSVHSRCSSLSAAGANLQYPCTNFARLTPASNHASAVADRVSAKHLAIAHGCLIHTAPVFSQMLACTCWLAGFANNAAVGFTVQLQQTFAPLSALQAIIHFEPDYSKLAPRFDQLAQELLSQVRWGKEG